MLLLPDSRSISLLSSSVVALSLLLLLLSQLRVALQFRVGSFTASSSLDSSSIDAMVVYSMDSR
jgi:hypothetical protein